MSATNISRLPKAVARLIASAACGLVFSASAWAQAPAQPAGTVAQQPSQIRALADSKVALQNGAFSSVIAIDVPAFRSLTPNLKLVYSSSGTNGFVGVGWDLSGFSTIERASPGRGSPRYGQPWQNDRYLLDGEELIPSVALGGTHATLRQSFLRISGTGSSWIVTRPNGTVMTYSPVFQTGAGTFRWGLTKTQDTHSNVVNYGWSCESGSAGTLECYPSTVTYANVAIVFNRESRTDRETFATGRHLGSRSYRLASVTIDVAGSRRNSYALSYTTSLRTGRSLLTNVRQLGRDNVTALPATTAAYSDAPSGFDPAVDMSNTYGLSAHIWNYSRVHTDDFNGDGRADMLLHYRYGQDARAFLLLADAAGGFGAAIDITSQYGMTPARWYYSEVSTADFNSDGKADLFAHHRFSNSGTAYLLLANSSNGFNFVQDITTQDGLTTNQWFNVTPTIADFNGDGKADILARPRAGSTANSYLLLADAFGGFNAALDITNQYGLSSNIWLNTTQVVADFNGDGKADILFRYTWGTVFKGYLLMANSAGGFTALSDVTNQYGLNDGVWRCSVLVPGDFNGDGRTDLLMQRHSECGPGPHYLLYATGSDGASSGSLAFDAGIDITNQYGMDSDRWFQTDIITGDYNGDGRTDLLLKSWIETQTDSHLILFSAGAGFRGPVDVSSLYGMTNKRWAYTNPRIADFDGDGDDDIFLQGVLSGFDVPHQMLKATSRTTNVITTLANGYGGTTTVVYEPSSLWANSNNPPRSQTVSALITNDGRGWTATTLYDYAGGAWDPVERRHLGFRYVKVVDPSDAYEQSYFYQGASFQIGEIEEHYKRNAANGVMTRKYRTVTGSSGAPWVRNLTQEDNYECNGDATCKATKTSYVYDAYGNVTTMTEHGDTAVIGDERTTGYGFSYNVGNYLVSYASRVAVHEGTTTSGKLLSEVLIAYDNFPSHLSPPIRGDATAMHQRLDARYLSTGRTFDGYGNETSVTTPLGFTTATAWDTAFGLYPSVQTNAMLHESRSTWNVVCGTKESETDANEQSTVWLYDNFCRRSRESRPDGGYTTWQYNDFGAPGAQHVREAIRDETPDDLWKRTYFDGLGRPYAVVSEGDRTVETNYDARGLVWRVSAPAATGEIRKFTSFAYDAVGRLMITTHPDTSTQRYLFDDWMTTTCDELGKPRSHFRDAYGQVRKVREYLGKSCTTWPPATLGIDMFETNIGFDLLGRQVAVADAKGHQSATSYDMASRRLASVDPDFGTRTYVHDDDGRMVSETDAKLVRVDYAYDRLNRLIKNGTGIFLYDQPGYGASIGRRTQLQYSSGGAHYTYDVMGRVIAEHRAIKTPPMVPSLPEPSPLPPPAPPPGPGGGYGIIKPPPLEPDPYPYPDPTLPVEPPVTMSAMTVSTGEETSVSSENLNAGCKIDPKGFMLILCRSYDFAGRLKTTTYHSGEVVENGYDSAGRLVRVGAYVVGATYDARDNLVTRTLGNGVVESFVYDSNRFWGLGYRAAQSAGDFHNVSFGRNLRGEVTSRANQHVAGDQWVFVYDDLRRLRTANSTGNPAWSQTFDYDELGRMTSQTGQGSYTYASAGLGPVHGPGTIGGSVRNYDPNGRLTAAPGLTIEYDNVGNAIQVNGENNEYDTDGQQVRTGATKFMSNLTEHNGNWGVPDAERLTSYYYFGETRVARSRNGVVHYYHGDQIGSASTMTDSVGNVVQRKVFSPFGAVLSQTGSLNDNPFGMAAQRLESSGLYHMGARKMSPSMGVFTSPDPSDAADPERPQTLNRFAYANNSPTNLIDPSGYEAKEPNPAAGAEPQASQPMRENAVVGTTKDFYRDLSYIQDVAESFLAKTERGAAAGFAAMALPFTERWQLELGANIVEKFNRYGLDKVTFGTNNGVTVPISPSRWPVVAQVHTHPITRERAEGFSGMVNYGVDGKGLQTAQGDLFSYYDDRINGYAYRVESAGGGAWRYDHRAFVSDLSRVRSQGGVIDSRWPRYSEKIK